MKVFVCLLAFHHVVKQTIEGDDDLFIAPCDGCGMEISTNAWLETQEAAVSARNHAREGKKA